MATRSFAKWGSCFFFTRYFIYVRCMIFLIDVRSLNLNSCPLNSEHVFSCDELVQFVFPCAGSYLVVNNSEVVKHHPNHVQRELDSSKNGCVL
jgi:hypothetical protein